MSHNTLVEKLIFHVRLVVNTFSSHYLMSENKFSVFSPLEKSILKIPAILSEKFTHLNVSLLFM